MKKTLCETKKYRFNIPVPSAKRMLANVYLVARVCGFVDTGTCETKYPIDAVGDHFIWEGPAVLEERHPEMLDADYSYMFWIEFNNSTHTRTERFEVLPQEVIE